MPRNALAVCSTVSSSQVLRLNLYQLRTRKPVARQVVGVAGAGLVGGEHLDDHPVVGHVAVERFDDPVAPSPDVGLALAHLGAEAVPVAVAPDVHPVPPPALAVLRARQEPVDDRLVGGVAGIGHEAADIFGDGQQPGQVERDAADQGRRVGGRPRRQSVLEMFGGQERVDRVADPARGAPRAAATGTLGE